MLDGLGVIAGVAPEEVWSSVADSDSECAIDRESVNDRFRMDALGTVVGVGEIVSVPNVMSE